MKKTQFSIGELSKSTGCHIETIRYYEKISLLAPAERSSGNQRRYNREHYQCLLFILHARDLGFPIAAIRQLLALSKTSDRQCDQADGIAARQLRETRAKINRLQLLEKELSKMIEGCTEHKNHHCNVIESLADCGACYQLHHSLETA